MNKVLLMENKKRYWRLKLREIIASSNILFLLFKSIFTHRNSTVCSKPALCYISLKRTFSFLHDNTTSSQMSHEFYTFCNHSFGIRVLLVADDDSEPILGLWFEETISPTKDKVAPPPPPPPPPLETSPRLKSPSKQNQSENGNILAGRKDPELVRNAFSASLTNVLVWS